MSVLISGCTGNRPVRDIERSFYYWKSSLVLDDLSKKVLQHLKIKRLYVKFFDVSWNRQSKQPMPMALLRFQNAANQLKGLTIIPVVFITNECIESMDTAQVPETAEKIFTLINQVCHSNGLPAIPEIQLDCDWNATTKNKYFALLRSMERLTAIANMRLSATVRLYQCKYAKKAGIPPVDRGLLMCYNMGNLKDISTANSILDAAELKKYTAALPAYPLPLDIALPLFEWKVLFRNNKYAGLINELPTPSLLGNPAIQRSGNHYKVLFDTTVNGYYLKKGDALRDERVTLDEIIKAADELAIKLQTQRLAVTLYHLDSLTLSKYSFHELETIFDHLR